MIWNWYERDDIFLSRSLRDEVLGIPQNFQIFYTSPHLSIDIAQRRKPMVKGVRSRKGLTDGMPKDTFTLQTYAEHRYIHDTYI